MSCGDCKTSIFRQKIGRCKRCMWQLTALSAIGWPLWWLYYDAPRDVNSIALLFFCTAFTGLLALHLIVLAYRRLRGRE
ncbi:DUF3624 domain-containing protein [Shewanella baltica]|uniref:DUF3624 domain-containing protein n=1 Tax=Shewanella scandinavica TaxID=3063538 RepID=A0ABU3G1Q0_9GAMM|nr:MULTISPECIES: DUF3624 domain-containing protein [Shewanella]MCS6135364.1 DUF3624 domain-containing protein [Shewanella baltica]MDT3281560.1 DUF3624 domain-containing protein [Shewanella sp. SP2S1-2]